MKQLTLNTYIYALNLSLPLKCLYTLSIYMTHVFLCSPKWFFQWSCMDIRVGL